MGVNSDVRLADTHSKYYWTGETGVPLRCVPFSSDRNLKLFRVFPVETPKTGPLTLAMRD